MVRANALRTSTGPLDLRRACQYARGFRIRMEQRQQTREVVPVMLGLRGGHCPNLLGA
jgi:hypothetical protein